MKILCKKDFIELYGEDAWKEEGKRRRACRNKEKDLLYESKRIGKRNDYFKKRRLEIYSTKLGRADDLTRRYRNTDKDKGFDISNNITKEWLVKKIFSKQCIYCGDSDWKHLGADRIDNSKPHTPDNVICACGVCNMERKNRFYVEEFKIYRSLHPRACDIPKEKIPILNDKGCLIKKINVRNNIKQKKRATFL